MKSARSWLHGRSALEELALRCCAWHTYHDWSGFFLLWSRVILRVHSHFSLRISRVQLRLHSEAFSFLSACLRVHASDSRSGDLLDRPIPFGEPRHDRHLRHFVQRIQRTANKQETPNASTCTHTRTHKQFTNELMNTPIYAT